MQYEGTKFTLLIYSSSTHSFISPKCIRNLKLHEHSSSPLTIELATTKRTRTCTSIGELKFTLGVVETSVEFRVLPYGVYDRILGMDWLVQNKATLQCKEGILRFMDTNDQEISAFGDQGRPKL